MLFISKSCAENYSTVYQNSFSIKRYLRFNFVFTFYIFSLIAILFICTRFLFSFSIMFSIINIINWMWWFTSIENKKRPNIKIIKDLMESVFLSWVKELKKLIKFFVISSQKIFFLWRNPFNLSLCLDIVAFVKALQESESKDKEEDMALDWKVHPL